MYTKIIATMALVNHAAYISSEVKTKKKMQNTVGILNLGNLFHRWIHLHGSTFDAALLDFAIRHVSIIARRLQANSVCPNISRIAAEYRLPLIIIIIVILVYFQLSNATYTISIIHGITIIAFKIDIQLSRY
jgi:hypothetical protein